MTIAELYASQEETSYNEGESAFETSLMALFEQAQRRGINQRDIAIIASTAIAVILTKQPFCQNAPKIVALRNRLEPHARV